VFSHEQPILYAADLSLCERLTRFDGVGIADAFSAALRRAGATVVSSAHHDFPGGGLTCVLILTESHAVVHTWPETGTVNIDIFSCSTRLKSVAAIGELGQLFGAEHITIQELSRADGHVRAAALARR
jgi:S-adenosylmethionine decarboxylase